MVNYNNLALIIGSIGYDRVLGWLGFSNIINNSSTIRAACIIHGGDRKDSFCLYKNTLIWRCFSRKCNEIYGSSFFDLVRAVFKCSYNNAINMFCSEFSIERDTFCDDNLDDNDKKDILFRSYIKNTLKEKHNVDKIKLNTKPCNYFSLPAPVGGGPFSDDILNFFDSKKCYIDKLGTVRALIPIYDENNILAGYSGRAIEKVDYEKYSLTSNMNAADILYNLNNVKNTLSDYIIVVEGYKGVWRLYEYGYDNVICCMGSLIKPNQAKLLIQTLKKIVLFFDPDTAGIQGTIITNNRYGSMLPIIPIISEFDRDPADLKKSEVDKMLSKYKSKNKNYV